MSNPPTSIASQPSVFDENPTIYLFIDTLAKWTGQDVDSLTIQVDGDVAALTLVLPTPKTVDSLPPADLYDGWIALIQGQAAMRCHISKQQCELLLDIALTYRAFSKRLHHVKTRFFKHFSELLIEAARSLDDHEDAEELLSDVLQWVHSVLPAVIFTSPPRIPPLAQPSDNIFELLAHLAQLFERLRLSPHPTGTSASPNVENDAVNTGNTSLSGQAAVPSSHDTSERADTSPASAVAHPLAIPTNATTTTPPLVANAPEDAPAPAPDGSEDDSARESDDDSDPEFTPDKLAQYVLVTGLYGAYRRREVGAGQFLVSMREALAAADVPTEPFLTRLSNRLPTDNVTANSPAIPPSSVSVERAGFGGQPCTMRFIAAHTMTTVQVPAGGDSTGTTNATAREDEEDGRYESEDTMPSLETPEGLSDGEEWSEEEFVRSVRNLLLRHGA